MRTYSRSGTPWYSYKDDITRVTMTEGVTEPEYALFASCQSLKTVTLQDGVLTVTLHHRPGAEFPLVVAAYDTDGRMTACTVPTIPTGSTITLAVEQAETLRIFVPDGTYCPVSHPFLCSEYAKRICKRQRILF
ncbi:MAG: hypothetical protein IJX64_02420 [Clostridia bacterium]|nr:hypothetical protein [Clostridia bacterium]